MSENSYDSRCSFWRGSLHPIPGRPTLKAKFLIKEGLNEMQITREPVVMPKRPRHNGIALFLRTSWFDNDGYRHETDPQYEAFADQHTLHTLKHGRRQGMSTTDIVRLLIEENRYGDDAWWHSLEVTFKTDCDEEEEFEDTSPFPPTYDSLCYHDFNPTVIPSHLYSA